MNSPGGGGSRAQRIQVLSAFARAYVRTRPLRPPLLVPSLLRRRLRPGFGVLRRSSTSGTRTATASTPPPPRPRVDPSSTPNLEVVAGARREPRKPLRSRGYLSTGDVSAGGRGRECRRRLG